MMIDEKVIAKIQEIGRKISACEDKMIDVKHELTMIERRFKSLEFERETLLSQYRRMVRRAITEEAI